MFVADDCSREHSLLSRALFLVTLLLAVLASWSAVSKSMETLVFMSFTPSLAWLLLVVGVAFIWLTRIRVGYGRTATASLTSLVAVSAKKLDIKVPEIVVSSAVSDASIKYQRMKLKLVVPVAIDLLARLDSTKVGGIIAHELAHIANGDAWRASLVRHAVRFATCLVVLGLLFGIGSRVWVWISWPVTYWMNEPLRQSEILFVVRVVSQPIGSAVALLLAYAAFMRIREFEADRIAGAMGYAAPLAALLRSHRHGGWDWLALHPGSRERASVLEQPREMHRVDNLAAGLLACQGLLLIDTAEGPGSGAIGVLEAVCFVVAQSTIAWIGYQHGRGTVSHRRLSDWMSLFRTNFAIAAGIGVALLITRATAGYEQGASFWDQAWESIVLASFYAAASICGVVTAYAIGIASIPNGGGRGFSGTVWLLIASAAALMSINILLPLLIIDPWGASHQTMYEKALHSLVKMLQRTFGEEIFDLGQFPLSYAEVLAYYALGGLVFVVSIWTTSLAVRWIGGRRKDVSGQNSNSLRGSLMAVAWVCCVSTIAWACIAPVVAIANEYRWRESIWLRCIDARTTKDREGLFALARQVQNQVGDSFSRWRSEYRSPFIAMLNRGCTDELNGYPFTRRLMARFSKMFDSYVEFKVSDREVSLTYQATGDDAPKSVYQSPLPLTASSVPAMATQIVWAHSPYRYAWMRVNLEKDAHKGDEALIQATLEGTARERAAAYSTYGSRRLQLHNDRKGAEDYFAKAAALWPDRASIAANYALALLSDYPSRCKEAGPWVEIGREKLTGEAAGQWARCLHSQGLSDEAIRFLWRNRRIHEDSATYEAVFGEIALYTGRVGMAARHTQNALKLSPNSPAGCARVHGAILKDPSMCSVEACKSPLGDLNAYETICWNNWAARYGHKF